MDIMEAAQGCGWAMLKKMKAKPWECCAERAFTFTMTEYQKLTVEGSLEKMVAYFSGLSCQCRPLTLRYCQTKSN